MLPALLIIDSTFERVPKKLRSLYSFFAVKLVRSRRTVLVASLSIDPKKSRSISQSVTSPSLFFCCYYKQIRQEPKSKCWSCFPWSVKLMPSARNSTNTSKCLNCSLIIKATYQPVHCCFKADTEVEIFTLSSFLCFVAAKSSMASGY